MAVSCYRDHQLIVREDETLHPNSLLITGYIFKPCIMLTSFLLPGSMEFFFNFESEFILITILVNLNFICMTGTIKLFYLLVAEREQQKSDLDRTFSTHIIE